MVYDSCYYLKDTHDVGVGNNHSAAGVTELQNISDFPSILELMNSGEDKAFKEDTEGINNGYPVLDYQ